MRLAGAKISSSLCGDCLSKIEREIERRQKGVRLWSGGGLGACRLLLPHDFPDVFKALLQHTRMSPMWLLIYESTGVMLGTSRIRSAAHLTASSACTRCVLPICAIEPRGMGDPWWVDTLLLSWQGGEAERRDCPSISKLLFTSLALHEETPEAGCCPLSKRKSFYFRSGCLTSFNLQSTWKQAQMQTDLAYANIPYLIFK